MQQGQRTKTSPDERDVIEAVRRQILAVVGELEAAIGQFERERAEFDRWAAAERASLAERRLV